VTLYVPGNHCSHGSCIALILSITFASGSIQQQVGFPKGTVQRIQSINNVGLDLCPTCIKFAEEALNILLNIILDTGILGTCQTLCQALADKTGSALLGTICDLVCDIVGIDEFIHIIEKADLDPIWYCEMATMCPVNDHGDAKFKSFNITPMSGRKGTTFTVDFTYQTVNGTGTGEIEIDIRTPDRIPLGTAFLWESKKTGTYPEKISIKAQPDPQCDPTQEPCEQWLPGTYNVTVYLCNGECGSKHPHSSIYDISHGSFVLTN